MRSARIGSEPLGLPTVEQMACDWPSWQVDTLRDQPSRLVRGLDTGKLHLYPRPSAAGTINLAVVRLPVMPMEGGSDTPELRDESHSGIVDWMLYRAYSRRDGDQHDPRLAAEALARFEAEFGRRTGARNEEWSRSGSVSTPPPLA
ncbi:hypothetical protein D3C86_1372660 [compost metagenome]